MKIKVEAKLKAYPVNDLFEKLRTRARANQVLIKFVNEIPGNEFKSEMTLKGEREAVMKVIIWLLKEPRLSSISRFEFDTTVISGAKRKSQTKQS